MKIFITILSILRSILFPIVILLLCLICFIIVNITFHIVNNGYIDWENFVKLRNYSFSIQDLITHCLMAFIPFFVITSIIHRIISSKALLSNKYIGKYCKKFFDKFNLR